jgi:4-amino-4-deoxy-L-arabinose transferase-like glycosyltransferase
MIRLAIPDLRRLEQGVVACLLVGLFAICLTSVRDKSLTNDEAKHWVYGGRILRLDSTRFDSSKMPISVLNALPRRLGEEVPSDRIAHALKKKKNGRVPTMLFSLGVAWLVWYWSRALYGPAAGLLALVLYVFDPNLIAHARLMTTDVYAAGTILLASWTFWRLWQRPGPGRSVAAAAALGLAQIAKYTAVFLYPLFVLLALLRDSPRWWPLAIRGDVRSLARRLALGLRHALLFLVGSIVVLNVAYLGNRTGTRLGDYEFRSQFFRSLGAAPILRGMPVPVPYPVLEGLDWVRFSERIGENMGPNYLLGERRHPDGFVGYYFIASLFKLPLATQAVLLLAALAAWTRRRDHRFLENELFLLGPIVFLSLYFNFLNRSQIGIRFFLPVFPLLYVLAGSLARNWAPFDRWRRFALGGLLTWLAISVLSYHPNFLTYMNELVWDRRQAYKVLADSNLDWKQDREWIEAWLADHPGVHFRPAGPVTGTVVVPASELVGVTAPEDRYRWLRENLEPVRTLRGSHLVYEVSPEDLARIP